MKSYKHQVLQGSMRKYIIGVKAALLATIIDLANKYPEVTRENCDGSNVHELLDIQDEFFEHDELASRRELFKALFRLFIAEYAHDPVEKFRIDWLKARWGKSNWVLPRKWAAPYWKELIGAKSGKYK